MNPLVLVKKVSSPSNWKKGINYLKKHGLKSFLRKVKNLQPDVDYKKWFLNNRVTEAELDLQRQVEYSYRPKISIVIPLYNTKENFLKAIVDSVLGQSYSNLELCLADGSTDDRVQEYIETNYDDERIIYQRLKENLGIAGNTNAALEMATGEFIMLSDHDDILELDALYEMVKLLNEKPDLDIVYTDEDLTDKTGKKFYSPRFKPDFNINLLRSINYICHIFLVRKEILDEVGGFKEKFDGAQDWDLILRCCEKTTKIGHVPRILYHWRAHNGSTAGNPDSKRYAVEAGRNALMEHYERLGMKAEIEDTGIFIMFRTDFVVKDNPKVSIIIANKDQSETLNTCIQSIENKSTYDNYEIIIVENNSEQPKTFDLYKELESTYDNLRVEHYKGAFNYSKVNNFGASHATGDYYILLNNDTEVITSNWIEKMLGYCQQDSVGIVGAKLLYPDDTVQHCGVVVGVGGFAGHIMVGADKDEVGYFGKLQAVQNMSAVTAACLMIKKSTFEKVGGLDEDFVVALNDIDLCLKVRDLDQDIIIHPGVKLYHYESKSRGLEETEEKRLRFKSEIKRFILRWDEFLKQGDPFYNPNLTLMYGDCRIKGDNEHFDIIDEIRSEL